MNIIFLRLIYIKRMHLHQFCKRNESKKISDECSKYIFKWKEYPHYEKAIESAKKQEAIINLIS